MEISNTEGKVALVTGAAQGIGEAVVKALSNLNFTVVAIDNNVDQLNKLVDELKSYSLNVTSFVADVSDSLVIQRMTDKIEEEIGPIEVLINVAGILKIGSIDSLSDEDWHKTFAVNSTGVFNVSRAVSKYMINRKKGCIVTVSSNSASVPRMGMAAYAASKAAATMFTKCLGLELAPFNIRCNLVSPGSTNTAMQWALWDNDNGEQAVIKGSLETYKVGIPLQKIATTNDIANAVLFLISDQASHITMNDLHVDGGATLGV
ncbi:2,3-dihydro-2,3-dihydroxybenzoate dehydrogenase [Peribacillus muralis]|uniref:2,3-dihydro-2,3-dihydroxybenzoate dehydrogenase n=1 Tax=Peribacillus muralis TaxID=264697 RepID=UPI003CFEC9FD